MRKLREFNGIRMSSFKHSPQVSDHFLFVDNLMILLEQIPWKPTIFFLLSQQILLLVWPKANFNKYFIFFVGDKIYYGSYVLFLNHLPISECGQPMIYQLPPLSLNYLTLSINHLKMEHGKSSYIKPNKRNQLPKGGTQREQLYKSQ